MKIKAIKIFFITFAMILSSQMAFAAGAGGANAGAGGNATSSNSTSTNSSLSLSIKIDNPIGDKDLLSLIDRIVGVVLKIGIPIIALFLLWAGFMYVMALGNSAKLQIAHRNLGHVILGAAIFLGAYTLSKVIIATIEAITK